MKQNSVVMLVMAALITVTVLLGNAQAKTKYMKADEIKTIMGEFNTALGVKCDFCHTTDRGQNYQDLAGQTADKDQLATLVHKRIARAMLGTMLYINKTEGKNLTCNTCHQGNAEVKLP